VTSDAELIREWYRTIKENSACITCQREGLPVEVGKVEFHHVDASSKSDTLSNMAIRPYILPMRYAVSPVTYAIELMKAAPICKSHHAELHGAEHKHDVNFLRDEFDFTDTFYVKKVNDFRKQAIQLVPPALIDRINDGLVDILHDGRLAFTKNGVELIEQDRSMDCSTLPMLYNETTPNLGHSPL